MEYFVSYYDYYQPEAYIPHTDTYIAKDAATNDAMTPMADINVIEEDIPYVSAHKSELVDKYTEIFTDLQSK